MRVGRGAGRVANIRLHHVAPIAAATALANGDAYALPRFLQNFAAQLQPASNSTTAAALATAGPAPVRSITRPTRGRP
jgi:hypothetical protein